MPEATQAQKSLADIFRIPRDQAHTINVKKALEYFKRYNSASERLERHLDGLFYKTEMKRRDEWM